MARGTWDDFADKWGFSDGAGVEQRGVLKLRLRKQADSDLFPAFLDSFVKNVLLARQ